MGTTSSSGLTLSEDERRVLIIWAVGCVERVLAIFERAQPGDRRLREGLEGARRFAAGELGVGPARALAFACHAAARESDDEAARAVARACGQAVAVAHMAGHARNVPGYTLKALRQAGASPQVVATEAAWQRDHAPPELVAYLYPA